MPGQAFQAAEAELPEPRLLQVQERCFVLIEAVAQGNGLVLLAAGYAVLPVLLKLFFFLFF